MLVAAIYAQCIRIHLKMVGLIISVFDLIKKKYSQLINCKKQVGKLSLHTAFSEHVQPLVVLNANNSLIQQLILFTMTPFAGEKEKRKWKKKRKMQPAHLGGVLTF